MSKEGYKYVCSKCKEVDELRSKLKGNQIKSKFISTSQEKEKAGRKNKTLKGKGRHDTLIIGEGVGGC